MPKFYRVSVTIAQVVATVSIVLSPAILYAFNINVQTLGI